MKKTSLYEEHQSSDAVFCNFGEYSMPLRYNAGTIQEHNWTREKTGVFDVSHMGQIIINGTDCTKFLQLITPSYFENTKAGRAKYTVILNDEGGIIDDLIITKLEEEKFLLVINSSRKGTDIKWIKEHAKNYNVSINILERDLIAVQGRYSSHILSEIFDTEKIEELKYMSAVELNNCIISRVGYTGEDGFEISVSRETSIKLWRKLLKHDEILPIGLGARDSLRMEMGYCLYGQDINEDITPTEADIAWVIGKNNNNFIGHKALKERECNKKRIGLRIKSKSIARSGDKIFNINNECIGKITSGCFSPTLQAPIAQCYLPIECIEKKDIIYVEVRGRKVETEMSEFPFAPSKVKK